ncbi:dihydroxyacetone kinase subunit L [Lentzea sp. NBRC 105346]|uniref:dihydroxyacetone kinase subunit DhaL n=1 Tax=Lentzea sp. NBRC 105346 TaxID=3032205 RepID=UPI0024A46EDD|nr:dihydroxyacetone kinase subunit DhaL [Lentzea sp. NBRC 105346]GLZ35004.1 dihydroxyacetone kinase subunit L [Lentzea sp. NBRC 105346]
MAHHQFAGHDGGIVIRIEEDSVDVAMASAWIRAVASAVEEHRDQLTQLDAAIGDADHGANMSRGFTAVLAALEDFQAGTVGEVLTKTGSTLMSTVGGASGPLYGAAFRAAGKTLTDATVTPRELVEALHAATAAVTQLGAATLGDKTMLDALAPAVSAFEEALFHGADLASAAADAAKAADEGAHSTIPLQARKGRASYLGPRSIGHQDPGATSTALIFAALAGAVAGR